MSLFSKGIPAGAHPDGITMGANGAMWFTQLDANAIGRVDAKGHVTEMPWSKLAVSEALATPVGAEAIVSAPARTLLFYLPGHDEFGRLSIDGRCVAPSLIGYDLDKVALVLRRAGCPLAVRDRHRIQDRIVVAQSARPGTLLARGTFISVQTVSRRVAAKRCIPSPAERTAIGDGRFVLFAEQLSLREGERVRFAVCVYGRNGIHATESLPERWEAPWGGGNRVEPLVAAGPYLAWQSMSWSKYETGSEEIEVLDVPAGKVIAHAVIGAQGPYGLEVQAVEIALDSEGHLAWRARIPVRGASRFTEAVDILDEADQVLTLESGSWGSFGALSFGPPGTLHWSSGGTARTFTFPR